VTGTVLGANLHGMLAILEARAGYFADPLAPTMNGRRSLLRSTDTSRRASRLRQVLMIDKTTVVMFSPGANDRRKFRR
jgi:hypothetical protein